ncbi:MAG: glycosyltransferase family 4 protein [Bryobacterales bacterium]|nr:glycosyltransferase family 4 protein [Bryobacterales bacterium]
MGQQADSFQGIRTGQGSQSDSVTGLTPLSCFPWGTSSGARTNPVSFGPISLIAAHPEHPQHRVLVGKDTSQSAEVRALARQSVVKDRIHFLGFVPDEMLPDFYNAADLFVFPSFYEGFGIPLLEAMACGRPIACSNRTALPEVAGKTAVLFDPASTVSIAKSLHDMLSNLDLCQKLGDAALERSRLFSWDHSARTVLEAYRHAVGAPVRGMEAPAPRALASGV